MWLSSRLTAHVRIRRLLYLFLSPGDLHRVAEAALQQKGVSDESRSPLDRLFLAALRRDAHGTLQLAHAHLGSWFKAHATELLAASGAEAHVSLKQPLAEGDGADQVEVYRVEYAMGLAQYPSTWHLARSPVLSPSRSPVLCLSCHHHICLRDEAS